MHPLRLLLKPSARRFFEEADRLPGFGLSKRLHGYLYLRWPYFYIGMLTGQHPLARGLARISAWLDKLAPGRAKAKRGRHSQERAAFAKRFAESYHGKVIPTEEATKLVKIGREVSLTAPESVVPYATARDIVLKQPEHIVVFDCPCRAVRQNHCSPMDVCMAVGEPFASMLLEHHQDRHARRVSADEAVGILKAENARGHVHHAFFKDVALGRFYAICNCCSCCCGAINAHKHGTPMLASSGYVVVVDEERCVGCGNCAKFCQFGALKARDRKLSIRAARCMGCGACVSKCPKQALSLKAAPERGAPFQVDALLGCGRPS